MRNRFKIRPSLIVACGLLWAGASLAAPTPQQKCQVAKFKAQGKLLACLKKQLSNVVLGKLDESGECRARFTTAIARADERAANAGTSCRYVDNGDGTVSDLNTGLAWEKKTTALGSGENAADPHDVDNTYTWSSTDIAPDGTVFTDFLAKLNDCTTIDGEIITGGFAGHCDWRLPSLTELQTILLVPFTCTTSPCVDAIFGPTSDGFHWSATTDGGGLVNADHAWLLVFSGGGTQIEAKTSSVNVRAVRGEPTVLPVFHCGPAEGCP